MAQCRRLAGASGPSVFSSATWGFEQHLRLDKPQPRGAWLSHFHPKASLGPYSAESGRPPRGLACGWAWRSLTQVPLAAACQTPKRHAGGGVLPRERQLSALADSGQLRHDGSDPRPAAARHLSSGTCFSRAGDPLPCRSQRALHAPPALVLRPPQQRSLSLALPNSLGLHLDVPRDHVTTQKAFPAPGGVAGLDSEICSLENSEG